MARRGGYVPILVILIAAVFVLLAALLASAANGPARVGLLLPGDERASAVNARAIVPLFARTQRDQTCVALVTERLRPSQGALPPRRRE